MQDTANLLCRCWRRLQVLGRSGDNCQSGFIAYDLLQITPPNRSHLVPRVSQTRHHVTQIVDDVTLSDTRLQSNHGKAVAVSMNCNMRTNCPELASKLQMICS
jgi:hypothetical protein